jgi:predicted nucleic acid-binding protein
VRIFFDTSIFVPLALGHHVHHRASQGIFLGLGRNQGFCAGHSLAEAYSSLTRMPPQDRMSADQAMLFLEEITRRLDVIALDAAEYLETITNLAAARVVGGTVYDGLIAQCALKAKADVIYTWNFRHFQQLGPEIEKRLRVPGDASTP